MSKIAKKKPTRLTETQVIALSNAARRDDGAIVIPDRIKGKLSLKLASKLIDPGLAREVRAKPGIPVYRRDDDGRGFSLLITEAGKSAINVAMDSETAKDASPPARKEEVVGSTQSIDGEVSEPLDESVRASPDAFVTEPLGAGLPPPKTAEDQADGAPAQDEAVARAGHTPPRAGTKIAEVIALLARPEGAKIADIIAATGWLPHTTRAALTGLRKRGYLLARQGGTGEGGTVYRIGASVRAEAA